MECDDCGELLDTLYKLQIHQLRAHNKGKLFSCHHCSFKSPRKKDVQGEYNMYEIFSYLVLYIVYCIFTVLF